MDRVVAQQEGLCAVRGCGAMIPKEDGEWQALVCMVCLKVACQSCYKRCSICERTTCDECRLDKGKCMTCHNAGKAPPALPLDTSKKNSNHTVSTRHPKDIGQGRQPDLSGGDIVMKDRPWKKHRNEGLNSLNASETSSNTSAPQSTLPTPPLSESELALRRGGLTAGSSRTTSTSGDSTSSEDTRRRRVRQIGRAHV